MCLWSQPAGGGADKAARALGPPWGSDSGPKECMSVDPSPSWAEGHLWRTTESCLAYTGVLWVWTSAPLPGFFFLSTLCLTSPSMQDLKLSAFLPTNRTSPDLRWYSLRTIPSSKGMVSQPDVYIV